MLIEERSVEDPHLAALLDAAFQELVRRYGATGRSAVKDHARYLVAWVGNDPAGCGAVQPSDDPGTAELKRLYVIPELRGRGVGSALLARLEQVAAGIGFRTIRLATGIRQPEALALYHKHGYQSIEPYGKYVSNPLIRCYQKNLQARQDC